MEMTMFRRYCESQAFRALIGSSGFHDTLEALRDKFNDVFGESSSSGTLQADMVDFNGQRIVFDKQSSLPPDARREVSEYIANPSHWHARQCCYAVSELKSCQRVQRFGMTFTPSCFSPRDSNVIIGTVPGDWSAGEIKHILSIEESATTSTRPVFFLLRMFKELEGEDIVLDPYRRFPIAGGRVFYDESETRMRVVEGDSILCHFVRTTGVISSIRRSHFHALPLDKVIPFGQHSVMHCLTNCPHF